MVWVPQDPAAVFSLLVVNNMASPQKENGYTAIANEILEAISRIRIPGEARQVLDVIIRKTYGFHKKQDAIALSQFCLATGLKKPTVCKAINKLKKMNLIIITQKGNGQANIVRFNKDFDTWEVLPKKVTLPKKVMVVTQKGNASLPKKVPTKDNTTKETITKDSIPPTAVQEVINYFFSLKGWKYESTPSQKKLFRRYLRSAKELLELCEGKLEDAKECLTKVGEWAKSRELDWSIETVFKKWYEIDVLKPKEKKPHWDGCRIFKKSVGGRWFIIRNGEVLELGRELSEQEIEWR